MVAEAGTSTEAGVLSPGGSVSVREGGAATVSRVLLIGQGR